MIPLILSLLLGAQLQAQTTTTSSPALKATIRLQIAKVAAPDASPDTALGNLGPIVATLLTPDGPVDIDYVVAGESMRGDVQGRLGMFTRGTIILQRVGEDSITVMNPGNHTWFELPATATLGSTMSAPDVQMEPTGERATIAGQRAERRQVGNLLNAFAESRSLELRTRIAPRLFELGKNIPHSRQTETIVDELGR